MERKKISPLPVQHQASSSKASSKPGSSNQKDTFEVQVVKPIVYGNVAWYIGEDDGGHTHQWTVYLKPYDNEDMSVYVKRVQFRLDDSFENSIRVCREPPYEVTERGWGEFNVIIKIIFQDSNVSPVTIRHWLKLFHG